ncbi:MAG: hypothetical protein J5I53_08155 [Bradyrhizobiaceae bacterium]|nr:hypothetical protein [Bradyrhizobiaceae bacterium]
MKYLLACLILLCSASVWAQEEMSDATETSNSWMLLSLHRVWTPQLNGMPNGGFGLSTFFNNSTDRRVWPGVTLTFTGLNQRYAMVLGGGVGMWLAGTGRLGLFSYAMTGASLSSSSTITGFNYFADPTVTVGWASQVGIGGCVELYHNIRLHLTGMAMHLSNEQGATPFGAQLGLVFGGR